MLVRFNSSSIHFHCDARPGNGSQAYANPPVTRLRCLVWSIFIVNTWTNWAATRRLGTRCSIVSSRNHSIGARFSVTQFSNYRDDRHSKPVSRRNERGDLEGGRRHSGADFHRVERSQQIHWFRSEWNSNCNQWRNAKAWHRRRVDYWRYLQVWLF